jgi:hypothetical protein
MEASRHAVSPSTHWPKTPCPWRPWILFWIPFARLTPQPVALFPQSFSFVDLFLPALRVRELCMRDSDRLVTVKYMITFRISDEGSSCKEARDFVDLSCSCERHWRLRSNHYNNGKWLVQYSTWFQFTSSRSYLLSVWKQRRLRT